MCVSQTSVSAHLLPNWFMSQVAPLARQGQTGYHMNSLQTNVLDNELRLNSSHILGINPRNIITVLNFTFTWIHFGILGLVFKFSGYILLGITHFLCLSGYHFLQGQSLTLLIIYLIRFTEQSFNIDLEHFEHVLQTPYAVLPH